MKIFDFLNAVKHQTLSVPRIKRQYKWISYSKYGLDSHQLKNEFATMDKKVKDHMKKAFAKNEENLLNNISWCGIIIAELQIKYIEYKLRKEEMR